MGTVKARSRPWLLVGGIVVLVLAVPAWRQFQIYSSVERSRHALRTGNFAEAIERLQQLNSRNGPRADVHYLLGVAHRRSGKIDQAFQHLQQAEDLGWPSDEVTCQRYMARFQAGDIRGTQEYLQQLVIAGTHDERAEEVYEALAKGFLAEFRVNDASVVLDHWIQWKPQAIQPRRWRAEIHEEHRQWPAAAKLYREIVNLSPNDLQARLHLADALLTDQQVEQSRVEFIAAQQHFPDDLRPVLGLAQCERKLGNVDEATKLLHRVVAEEKDKVFRAVAWVELGQMATEAGDYTHAIEHYERALKDDPHQSQAHHLLGNAYARLGRDADAKLHLAKAEELLDRGRRLRDLSLTVVNEPTNVNARFEIAQMLRDMGNMEESTRWLLTVIHLDPRHRPARLALAEFFDDQGEHDLAAGHRRAVNSLRSANTPQANAPQAHASQK